MGKSKEQFIEETGGFHFGETPADFHKRVTEIQTLKAKANKTTADIERLNQLKGIEE